jgi:phenolic acid decarboxylase
MFKYVGAKIDVNYETGYHFEVEFLSDSKLRWTSLKERDDGAPMVGEETFYPYELDDGIYAINWIEDTGIVVAQNLNFKKMEVHAFMTWNDKSARGGRAMLDHKGSIKVL